MQLLWGYAPPLILESAIRHRFFNLPEGAPKTAVELARESGASLRGVAAICNALVGLEFLARAGDRYALTPESAAFLVAGKPAYQGALFRHISTQLVPRLLEVPSVSPLILATKP